MNIDVKTVKIANAESDGRAVVKSEAVKPYRNMNASCERGDSMDWYRNTSRLAPIIT
jgi:hypothetical protein